MTDREKLVDLLDNLGVYDDWYANTDIADHLLANGVAVQQWMPLPEPPKEEKMMDKFCKECAYAPKSNECHTCKVSCFDGEPMGLPSNFKRKSQPMTNADRIRGMTDEELAASDYIPCPYDNDDYGECKYGWHDREQTCEECKLEWLKQPVKEDE